MIKLLGLLLIDLLLSLAALTQKNDSLIIYKS